jgi:uncharacterized membrane protein
MIGLDWFIIIIALAIIGTQTTRGTKDFGSVLFEMLTVTITAIVCTKWYAWISDVSRISPMFVFIFLFVILELILLIIAGTIVKQADLTWPPFDSILSFFFGIVTAWALLYILLRIASLGTFPLISHTSIEKSGVAQEILGFKTFHALINFLNKLST